MSQITVTPPGTSASARSVRHGLIEDWRDAVGILLLLLVATFLGALITRFLPEPEQASSNSNSELVSRLSALESRQFPTRPIAEITALKERLAKLEARLANFEVSLAGTGTPGAVSPLELARRLATLETATAPALEALTSATTALTTQVDNVAERLVKLESSDLLTLARRASLASSIANLTRAAQGSSPFNTEYDVVFALLPADAHLKDIAPLAAGGLPTTGTLISVFGSTADASMDAESLSQGKTWWTRLWANFSSLVSWRSTVEAAGNSTESRLARAGLRLKAGDLEAAVSELNAIKGAARKPLEPWLTKAAARVRVETALAALNTQAIEAITGPIDSSEPVPQLPAP